MLYAISVSAKCDSSIRNGAFVWGIHGACDFLGGNCTYVQDTLTTCKNPCECIHLIKVLGRISGVDSVAIQIVPT